MERTSNGQCRKLVEGQKNFIANHIYGQNISVDCYAVFSYGSHFPMYVWVAGKGWHRNVDKYSVTTSKHQNQTRPNVDSFIDMTTSELKDLIAREQAKDFLNPPEESF